MKKRSPNDSIGKSRRFYAVLYSCLGVALVLAAVISFTNFDPSGIGQNDQIAQNDEELTEQVVKNSAQSYLTPEDRENEAARKSQTPAVTVSPSSTASPEATSKPSSANPAAPVVTPEAAPANIGEEMENNSAEPAESTVPAATEKKTSSSELAEPVFNSFVEGSSMFWPVDGEIVMDYSVDHTIYDKTLEHFRTNASISIAAPVGTQVKAASDGVVKSVTSTRETGNTVVIDNGNGWLTTYSQLQDQVLVNEGDVVKAGQVIGGVNNPTLYKVLLGSHLDFSVSKDDASVDPKTVLAKNED